MDKTAGRRSDNRRTGRRRSLRHDDAPHTMITSPQMVAIVMVLARAVVISSSSFESHGWKHVVATRAHVVGQSSAMPPKQADDSFLILFDEMLAWAKKHLAMRRNTRASVFPSCRKLPSRCHLRRGVGTNGPKDEGRDKFVSRVKDPSKAPNKTPKT